MKCLSAEWSKLLRMLSDRHIYKHHRPETALPAHLLFMNLAVDCPIKCMQ